MIGGAVERDVSRGQSSQRIGQRGARRIESREMKQAGAIRRRRRTAGALPRIQPDVMMIATGGNERGLLAGALHQFEAEDSAIESERSFEVGHLEMDVTYADAGINWCRHQNAL